MFFRWRTSAFFFFFQNNSSDHIFISLPGKERQRLFFFTRVFCILTDNSDIFGGNHGQKQRHETCKCVYLKRVFIQDIFPNTFYRLWRVVIVSHTHAPHPNLFKKTQSRKRVFSCCHFFSSLLSKFHVVFPTLLLILHHHNAAATSRRQSVTLLTELL